MTSAETGAVTGRPSPDALLQEAAREERGRLKIFLGAAPGVGKTYEMLQAGQRRRREGADVVVGVVETHGRAETGALLHGLEILPRRLVDYRGNTLQEMDLDAILARRPELVLVDELAHTNAPGSRHPKRHLDVAELLAAGIDVYTTLNIQHVESLNDVVAQITRVRVRETVPDSVLDRADDIEVIDLSPDDLIQRLKEGKVYVPAQARQALEHYFSPGNLTALRELALRRTAERVDEQLRSHMQAHAIEGPWPAGERLLVCISEDPKVTGLVRHAKRAADRLHAPWTALYIETPRSHRLGERGRDRIAEALRLAEQLGGEAMTLPGGGRIADDVLTYARANNVTQIVIGKSDRPRWFEMLHGSVVHDLVRHAGAISVHIVAGETVGAEADGSAGHEEPKRLDLWSYAIATAAVALALGLTKLTEPVIGIEAADLIFLFAVLGVAAARGLAPSLFASVLASLAYNFFFLPPIYTFTIAAPANVAAFVVFLGVAIVVSNLAARVRSQMLTAKARARTTEALYAFSRKLAGIVALDDLLWAASYQIASMLKLDVVFLLPEAGRLEVKIGYPPEDILDEADIGAAKWAFENNRTAGRGSDTLAGAKRLFLPIGTGRGAVGVVGLNRERPGALLSPDERRLLDALTDQTAIAIERVQLARSMDEARMAAETERLRSALLTSLSHDLKTPLASITGAATSLRQYPELYDARQRKELIETIEAEADRLGRFVANLLDMARLEAGPIELSREPVDIGEVVATALTRTAGLLKEREIAVVIEASLPMLALDVMLFEQALVNLIDNATRYTPAGGAVAIEAKRALEGIVVEVRDEGPGIPPEELEQIFEKFHRVRRRRSAACRHRAGSGHLPRFRRSAWRQHQGRQSHRPLGRGLHDRFPRDAFRRSASPRGSGMTKGIVILVVDDEPPIRRLLRTSLGAQGFELVEAADATTALSLAASEKPEIILLDLGLPDLDGTEVIRRLRASGDKTPIIVLSSRGDGARQGGGARSRRRRLCDEAVRHGGARRAHPHRAPPPCARRGRRAGFQARRSHRRPHAPPCDPRRRRDQTLAEGIRHPPAARAARRQGADAPDDHAGSMERRGRRPVSAHLHPPAAAEARGRPRSAGAHTDGNRRWLPAGRPGRVARWICREFLALAQN